jgi:hypothetical protein
VSVCAPAGSTNELPVKHSSIVGTHDVRHGHSMADQQLGDGIMSRNLNVGSMFFSSEVLSTW